MLSTMHIDILKITLKNTGIHTWCKNKLLISSILFFFYHNNYYFRVTLSSLAKYILCPII